MREISKLAIFRWLLYLSAFRSVLFVIMIKSTSSFTLSLFTTNKNECNIGISLEDIKYGTLGMRYRIPLSRLIFSFYQHGFRYLSKLQNKTRWIFILVLNSLYFQNEDLIIFWAFYIFSNFISENLNCISEFSIECIRKSWIKKRVLKVVMVSHK